MQKSTLSKIGDLRWEIPKTGEMNVPCHIFATDELLKEMDEKVREQLSNVACLPGIQVASISMPDAHWGYGFPIGGVAAFDPAEGGVISMGGVGFDIACGVRMLKTGLKSEDVAPRMKELVETLFQEVPAGLGSTGEIRLKGAELDDVLTGGAVWAVDKGYGRKEDLEYVEENGRMEGADPSNVSDHAKKREEKQIGTLGSGNHYLEIQQVTEIYDSESAGALGLEPDDILVAIHCGSRGLGHQIATEFLKRMATSASSYGIELPERDLACAPINSPVGRQYLGAMRSGINCALANRQLLTHLLRQAFASMFAKAELKLLYDVSHNTCKEETHVVNGQEKRLFVHRKGATRAFGPGDKNVPAEFRSVGQPVLIGGTMGTASYILVGTRESMSLSFGSSCHGAGRCMSRKQATKQWQGRDVVRGLEHRGILIRCPSYRGVAEEAPGAYKDVSEVVEVAHNANLSRKVAKLLPLICIKG